MSKDLEIIEEIEKQIGQEIKSVARINLSHSRNYLTRSLRPLNNQMLVEPTGNVTGLYIGDQKFDFSLLESLKNLKCLSLFRVGLQDLSSIGTLTQVTDLRLNGNELDNISSIASLTKIERLELPNCQLSDISPIASLVHIKTLNLSGNQLSDISPIDPLTKITELDLGENQIRDITPIGSLVHITYLNLRNNQLSDISPLSSLKKIRKLDLEENQISDISPAASLINIKELNLNYNELSDISPIKSLYQIRKLDLRDNLLSDISPLLSLKGLKQADLSDNQVKILPSGIVNFSLEVDKNLFLGNNPLRFPPVEIIQKGKEAMQRYFESMEKKEDIKDSQKEKIQKPTRPAAFFSYVRLDDEYDQHWLNRLRERIAGELTEQIGEPFDLFFDSKDIKWRMEWEQRLNSGLDHSTFLIAIITPSYLKSESCRQEFLRFLKLEKRLNRNDLIVPILYIKTPALEKEPEDPIVAELKQRNFLDWTKLRFKEPGSVEVLKQSAYLSEMIVEAIDREIPMEDKQRRRKVIKLKSIALGNIGVFSNLKLSLDQQCTALIGLNGVGKTTILRALALAIIGPNERLSDDLAYSLLRILKREGTTAVREMGAITLEVEVDGESHSNKIVLQPWPETDEIEVQGKRCEALFSGDNPEQLILGFGQQRRMKKKHVGGLSSSSLPKTGDIIPLINNDVQHSLDSFLSWISNLDHQSRSGAGSSAAVELIDLAFQIFSEIAEEQVEFDRVTQVDPLELWVKTGESPQGIPAQLTSQGWQALMGWLGHLLERMSQVYGDPRDFSNVPAIVLIDEIDFFFHPKWQKQTLPVLRKFFPATQFIITTHSPLIIDGLERGQVYQLQYQDGTVSAEANQVDLWGWHYQDILEMIFGVHQNFEQDQETALLKIKELEQKEEQTKEDQKELQRWKDILHRLEVSHDHRRGVTEMKRDMQENQKALAELIEELKGE